MGFIESAKVFERFLKDGRNSSHFVWFPARLRFFETSGGWIFGFLQIGDVTLIALEPLIPGSPTQYSLEHQSEFNRGWEEFKAAVAPKITAFVSIYTPFADLLHRAGFQTLKIGREPWVNLTDCVPRGNAGKGVRSARNQALHAGLTVEEWSADSVVADPVRQQEIQVLHQAWRAGRVFDLSGFLNANDPFIRATCRRYFIARSRAGVVQGYLIATPVAGINGIFIEDLVLKEGAARGTGELLTLEALVALGSSSVAQSRYPRRASLGVISVNSLESAESRGLPKAVEFMVLRVPALLKRFYNFEGMETFRKRFKPEVWEDVHLAVRNDARVSRVSSTHAWLKVMLAIVIAFRPRPQLSFELIGLALRRSWRKHPISHSVACVSLIFFGAINHFGRLPEWAINRFGFFGGAPLWQWPLRSISSDFLYFDPVHFVLWGALFVGVLRWAERSHKREFLIPFFVATVICDDFINYLFILKPFSFLEPGLFRRLVSYKDVGGSLGLMTFVGLQLNHLRRGREIIFAILSLGVVLGFMFSSAELHSLVLNMNHFLFLSLGYICGRLKFEYLRKESQRVAKNRPPRGKCVLSSVPGREDVA